MSNTPLLEEFDPFEIKWQGEHNDFVHTFDYSQGILEDYLSGGVGSAKTIAHVHNLVRHCLEQNGSQVLMLRRTLKDLKRTSWKVMIQHIAERMDLVSSYNISTMTVTFINGSVIMGDSFDDGEEEKYQSLNLSMFDVEEGNEMPKNIYDALFLRVGRAGVPVNRVQIRSNPDDTSHWLYKHFILDKNNPMKSTFYSVTKDNKFLPKWYYDNLKKILDPLMARRKLYGEWLDISRDKVYYAYNRAMNFVEDKFIHDYNDTLLLSHDFNIGKGKPMSANAAVRRGDTYHAFQSFHVEGARTADIMETIAASGLLDTYKSVKVYGDASNNHNDTRSITTDYEIIEKFLSNYIRKDGTYLRVEMCVPRSNPPIRRRHNLVNAHFLNENNDVRLLVYDQWLDEGFRLTSFLKNGHVENDTLAQQHCTTAIGYMIDYDENKDSGESEFYQM